MTPFRTLLNERGLKQGWVARQIGLSLYQISAIAHGRVKLPADRLEPLAALLRVEPIDLMKCMGAPSEPHSDPLLSMGALLDAVARGLTQSQYAREIGATVTQVRNARIKWGVQFRDGRKDNRGSNPPKAVRNAAVIAFLTEPHTLQETGDKFGITRERVRQIYARAGGKREPVFSAARAVRHAEIVAERAARRAASAERKRARRELAETFAAGRLAGRGTHEMAREFGCSQTHVGFLIAQFHPELVLSKGQQPSKVFGGRAP